MITWYWSVKGGVGTSVVAAATAIRLASDETDTVLVDLTGDQPALLGLITGSAPSEPGIGDWVAAGEGVAADAIARLLEDVSPHLRLLRRGTVGLTGDDSKRLMLALEMLAQRAPVIVDAGLDPNEARAEISERGRSVCVLRACYLALSRAQKVPGPYDRLVLVEEPGRALRSRDVAAAVGADSVERIPWDPRVARSVDSGTIVSMMPPPLRRFELPG